MSENEHRFFYLIILANIGWGFGNHILGILAFILAMVSLWRQIADD